MVIRAGDVQAAYPLNQGERGGSIPTPALHFHMGRYDDATHLVMKHHYSRRWPSNVQFVGTLHQGGGLFGTCGEAAAACVFCVPATRWSENVLELSRLVRADQRVPLSRIIKLTVVYIKRSGMHDLLVSFADWTQRHHGGVYQSASWNYAGQRDSAMDGLIIDGTFVNGRTCNHVYGTRSPERLRDIHPSKDIQPHYDEGKHLYWKALNKAGEKKAKRLRLESLPYPKPERLKT